MSRLRSDDHDLKRLTPLQKQLAEIEAALKQAQEAEAVFPQLSESVQALDKRLAGDFAPEIGSELAAVAAADGGIGLRCRRPPAGAGDPERTVRRGATDGGAGGGAATRGGFTRAGRAITGTLAARGRIIGG